MNLKIKIVCTIGPSSDRPEMIRDLILNGMNVARLNFSHGTHGGHKAIIDSIRTISEEAGKPVAILQDLCGPKIRVGRVPEEGIRLEAGQSFILTSEPVIGNKNRVSVSYADLPGDVKKNDRILLADGMMELQVIHTTPDEIHCMVLSGGLLTSNKGVNVPTGRISLPSLTEKDHNDLLFGLRHDVDFIALSFVREAQDILKVKQIIAENSKTTPVIAKIEKHEAIDHIDEIFGAADGIMVARGDLGVELPLEQVPILQKRLIHQSNRLGKPVIIATQMLRSMVDSPRPTRAEAADVANGVLDGADAVMLSEETAVGKYPLEALRYMARIAQSAEAGFPHERHLEVLPKQGISQSVAHAACVLAGDLDAAAIIASTHSGSTAGQISRFRPKTKIIAVTPDPNVYRRLALCWGCIPLTVDRGEDMDEMIEKAAKIALTSGYVKTGDRVVFTAGHPLWVAGTTNMLQVRQL
ncbi:MAG: pyruvate kinase [Pseudomonadota bacterium]